MKKLTLRKTQKLLWKLIAAPEGVEKALDEIRRKAPLRGRLHPALPVEGATLAHAISRLDIYANMYFFRIRDNLKEDFPGLLRVLGEEGFHNLITDYLLRFPPTDWSLRNAGERLPLFLKKHLLSKRHPFLGDLAQFEWELIEVFDAPDAVPLNPIELQALPPTSWGRTRFRFIPAFRKVLSRWNLGEIRSGEKADRSKEGYGWILWRPELKTFFRRINKEEGRLLEEISRVPFGTLCSKFVRRGRSSDVPSRIAAYLKAWVNDRLLDSQSIKLSFREGRRGHPGPSPSFGPRFGHLQSPDRKPS